MTHEQYNKSIETEKLQLEGFNKISYYFLVVLLFSIPAFCVALDVFDNSKNFVGLPIWFIAIPAILGCLLYLNQQKGLKFQVVETSLTSNELSALLKNLCDELQWSAVYHDWDIFVAKTNNGDSTWTRCKQVTVLFDKSRVFVNSVYDLDAKSSVDLLGKNKDFETTIIGHIKKAETDRKLLSTDRI